MNTQKWKETIPADFSGCVLLTKAGETLFVDARGWTDMSNRLPNRIDTRFATASAGKAFVAVGILQQIERGALRFDSALGEIIPRDWKGIDPTITVRELLTHTSGIPDYFDESVMEDYDELWRDYPNYKIRRSEDLLPLFIEKPMLYPRGERFQYNNTGYVVLGMMLEAITGEPFDTCLQKNVFEPCGMTDTGYFELDRLPARCANAYIYDETREEYYTNIYSVDVKGTGAGGAFTTVRDVRLFWDGLFGGKLLSEQTVREMASVHAEGDDELYGYGLWISRRPDGSLMPYFEGCDPGVSFLSAREGDGTVLTVVSNFGQNVWRLFKELREQK